MDRAKFDSDSEFSLDFGNRNENGLRRLFYISVKSPLIPNFLTQFPLRFLTLIIDNKTWNGTLPKFWELEMD